MSDKMDTCIHIQDGKIWIGDMYGSQSGIPISEWPVVRDEIDRMIADAKAPDQRSQRAQESGR